MDSFDALQQKLVSMWSQIGTSLTESYEEKHTAVVVPSVSVDVEFPAFALQAYEERLLFMLFLLRKPDMHIIYLTSQPIRQSIIDYYLELIPGVISAHARKRLHLLSAEDGSPIPLTQKILERPHLVREIRAHIPDFDRAHIVPFNTTDLERELAVQVGIPMYAADPRFYAFGTKSGCRQIFAEEGVTHPLGAEDIYSEAALVEAMIAMRAERPTMQRVVVKLNEGVSGFGNVVLNLAGLPPAGADDERAALNQLLEDVDLEDMDTALGHYTAALEKYGGIVEEYISGEGYHSPSVQLRVTPTGGVELLSTHDQLLGGADGQIYLGAIFPANPEYAPLIIADALKIGERFAKEGILGRFAIDFVVVQSGDGWESYAIEVNLRKGGTTAPFLILQYLTDGRYISEEGIFKTPVGQTKYYVATDHLDSDAYRVFSVDDLLDLASHHRFHYNHATQTGVVMHMLTGVGELGRVGVTVIENSPELAQARYAAFAEMLNQEAAARGG